MKSTSPYAFRSRTRRALCHVFDALGGGLFRLLPAPRVRRPLQRILVVRLDHLGDGIFAGPALRALRGGLPQAHITLLAGPWGEALYGTSGFVDAVHVVSVPWFARPPSAWSWSAWFEVLSWVRDNRFDAAIDLRGDLRHLLWLAVARVPVRLGYGRTGGGFLSTERVVYRQAHEVERNLDLVRVLVPDAVAGPLVPIPCTPADDQAVAAALRVAGGDPQAPFVVFHVGAGYASKRWEPDAMARAIEQVEERFAGRAVLVGTLADREAVAAVVACLGRPPLQLVGQTTLGSLACLVRRAQAFVGHDSGPAHLAVACGAPCVLVYSGVNDPLQWGPWGGEVRLLRTPVECSPCGLAICNRHHECMRDLAPKAVADGIAALVARERA